MPVKMNQAIFHIIFQRVTSRLKQMMMGLSMTIEVM